MQIGTLVSSTQHAAYSLPLVHWPATGALACHWCTSLPLVH
jgi:hypothetical protein